MKSFNIFFLLFFCSHSFAQFAIVTDKDGSTNVRLDANASSKINSVLQNGHLIYCLERKGNWTNIDYTIKGKELNGYVYKDRYQLIDQFSAIPITTKSKASVVLKKDSIQVTIIQGSFNKNKHSFKYYKEAPGQIELIDNKKYWGTDGEMPATQYETIEVAIGTKKIVLPRQATTALYEPNIFSATVYYDQQTNSIYISTMNSDGAGAYEVVWKIENGIYKDRLIAYGF